jgi:hypothetical protein
VLNFTDEFKFYFAGISLGHAHAHPNRGDTFASVMLGGVYTIMNGPLKINVNDQLTW